MVELVPLFDTLSLRLPTVWLSVETLPSRLCTWLVRLDAVCVREDMFPSALDILLARASLVCVRVLTLFSASWET